MGETEWLGERNQKPDQINKTKVRVRTDEGIEIFENVGGDSVEEKTLQKNQLPPANSKALIHAQVD